MSDEPTQEQITQALDALPRLPRLLPVLNASMDPLEMVTFGSTTEKYQVDSDFHLLIDMVQNLLTTISEVEDQYIRLKEEHQ